MKWSASFARNTRSSHTFPSTSTSPMTASFSIGNRISQPASNNLSPPMPSTPTSGRFFLMDLISCAAKKSPEGSPATIPILTSTHLHESVVIPALTNNPTFGPLDEPGEIGDFTVDVCQCLKFFQCIFQKQTFPIDDPVSLPERINRVV